MVYQDIKGFYYISVLTSLPMKALNLPTYSFKIKSDRGKDYIFDIFRKKYVKLSPEEWVRQNFALYLVQNKNYPSSRIIVEKTLEVNRMMRRCDIVVGDDYGNPVLIVECKAPEVRIGQETFEQLSVYNISLKVPYLILTNGIAHFMCKVDFMTGDVNFLPEIPDYFSLLGSDTNKL